MEGGPIALIRNGDRIRIDIMKRTVDLLVSDADLAKRLAVWKKPQPKIKKGWLRDMQSWCRLPVPAQ